MIIRKLFINYFYDKTRASPINLAAMRVILGIYVLWRGASIDAQALAEWPAFLYTLNRLLYPPEGYEWILIAEKYLLLFAALTFIIGYRTRISAFATGIFLSHLTGVMMLLNTSGETQQMAIGAMFILLSGLYAENDKLSVDGIRRTRNRSLDEMNDFLKNPPTEKYQMTALRLSLLSLGILYAGAAYIKIRSAGLFSWTSPGSLARWTTYFRDILSFDFSWRYTSQQSTFTSVIDLGNNCVRVFFACIYHSGFFDNPNHHSTLGNAFDDYRFYGHTIFRPFHISPSICRI
jgi:uncharacterized membrane protein YphA (DoxX/SURF4 family)